MSTSWLWTSAWMTILVIQADLVEDALPGWVVWLIAAGA
jgi:hypothetical protein